MEKSILRKVEKVEKVDEDIPEEELESIKYFN